MTVKVLILEDNPVARDFLSRVLRESFSDPISITEAGDLETARAPNVREKASYFSANFEPLVEAGVLEILDGAIMLKRR